MPAISAILHTASTRQPKERLKPEASAAFRGLPNIIETIMLATIMMINLLIFITLPSDYILSYPLSE